jgi:hypothetical protein
MQKEMSGRAHSRLKKFRKNIDKAYTFMKKNYERYNNFTRMTDVSTISPQERTYNLSKNRPDLDFNILNRMISQLRGEYSKSQNGISVGKKDGTEATEQDIAMIDFIEGHMRYQFHEMKVNGVEYDIFTQILKGGFSGGKVYADYTPTSGFEQDIIVDTLYDPTLIGFDPFAKKVDKGDGAFIFEAIPYEKERAEKEFNVSVDKIKASYSQEGFKWSFKAGGEDIVMVVDYYYKKYKNAKYVLLSNQDVVEENEYDEYVKRWNEEQLEQAPVIIAGPIVKQKVTIWRAKIIGNYIIEEEPTDLVNFPIIYCDGNSSLIKDPSNTSIQYHTKPYTYDAVGTQRLKNFAGQSLAYSLMKTIQSPFMASNESLRGQNPEPWKNPQEANILTYNEFKDNNPDVRLTPPIQISPTPIPPEIMQAFQEADRTFSQIMGGMDLSIGNMSEAEMSGKAIQQRQTMGNAAAMPYVNNMIRFCQSCAERILELIPLYYTTPRSVPVMDGRGRRSYIKINQEGGLSMDFNPSDFEIKIEAGANFAVQQERTKQEIVALANAIPAFGQFIADKGLPIILDNLSGIRGVEELKKEVDDWMAAQEEMKAQMAQMPNPDLMKTQLAEQKLMMESKLAEQKMIIDDRNTKIKALTDIGKLKIDKEKNKIEAAKVAADFVESRHSMALAEDELEYDKVMQLIGAYKDRLQQDFDEMERNFRRALSKYEAEKPEKVVATAQ